MSEDILSRDCDNKNSESTAFENNDLSATDDKIIVTNETEDNPEKNETVSDKNEISNYDVVEPETTDYEISDVSQQIESGSDKIDICSYSALNPVQLDDGNEHNGIQFYSDNYEYPVEENTELKPKKSPKMLRVSTVVLIILLTVTVIFLLLFMFLYFSGVRFGEKMSFTDPTEKITEVLTFEPTIAEESISIITEPATDIPKEDGYILYNSDTHILSESELEYLTDRELELARNEIYARHGRKFDTDYIQQYFNSRSWYEGTIEPDEFDEGVLNDIEKYNISFIKDYEEKLSSDTLVTEPESYNDYIPKDYYYDDQSTQETVPDVNVKTVNVKGVEFSYVNSYNYTAEYTGDIIDYNIKLDIKYCEPSKYMSDNDRIIGISSSSGMYEESDIGSLYKSAGYDDFAVFEVKVSGDYTNEFYGYNNIEFRKYNHSGVLLKNIATQVTDYELLYLDSNEGTINEKLYIGFYKSEVGSVDFKILGVGPNGLGEW